MILLSYIGVHQIFQLALAAEELGSLEALHCSVVDRPGKWGASLATLLPLPSARAAGSQLLPSQKLIEHPLPLLANRLASRLPWHQRQDHRFSNSWFDRMTERAIGRSHAKVFVGVETCALFSMQAAKKRGMICVLDCPGVPVRFLDEQARLAAAELDLPTPSPANSDSMLARKDAELALADHILCCSDFQSQELQSRGVPAAKIHVVPLWADTAFWSQPDPPMIRALATRKLKVIFAGAISLKKGAAYLLDAMRLLGDRVECLFVGRLCEEMQGLLSNLPPNCRVQAYLPKEQLRQAYREHDVLVMPTLGDSFGFVGMEAMAAGLPVIASAHAGLPLPSPDWRVPVRDAQAIATRLRHYLDHPEALAQDSATARAFVAQFTPERYRQQIQDLYRELLESPNAT